MAVLGNASRSPVDWGEVRQRMEAAGRSLAGATDRSPESVRDLLEERARALAQPAAQLHSGETFEVITFALANEVYAVESRYVTAVFQLLDLSPLPGAEPPVFGVTAWRGELLTILDLRQVLGISVAALNDLSRVIVLGEDRAAFGLLADAVHELVMLSAAQLRELPQGSTAKREYLRGMTANAVIVLDAKKLLRMHA